MLAGPRRCYRILCANSKISKPRHLLVLGLSANGLTLLLFKLSLLKIIGTDFAFKASSSTNHKRSSGVFIDGF
jgi:hypothetical protein